MTTIAITITAPAGSVCEVCARACAGDEVETVCILGTPHYSHVDLLMCLRRWQAKPAERMTEKEAA